MLFQCSSTRSSFFAWYFNFIIYYSTVVWFFCPCETMINTSFFIIIIFFFLNNLLCCWSSEISRLWYIIVLIKLQILKNLQKSKAHKKKTLFVSLLPFEFSSVCCEDGPVSSIKCNYYMYYSDACEHSANFLFIFVLCLFTYHLDIIPPTFEWHFSYKVNDNSNTCMCTCVYVSCTIVWLYMN